MQKTYEHFTAADFVSDDAFINHYISPDEQSAHFWKQWLARHPRQLAEWQDARQLLEAVRLGLSEYARTYLSEEAEAQLLIRILATNALADAETPVIPLGRPTWFNRATIGWAAAACLLIGVGLGGWLFTGRLSVYDRQLASLNQAPTEQSNQTQVTKLIQLPDGSSALLFPQSRLSYPADFGLKSRPVYLVGKATFDVVKNPAKPFYVYANELVTRVLGTKFTVEAFDRQKEVVVTVQHGQVNVYPNRSFTAENAGGRALKGVLILPNQQVVFSRQSAQFAKKIVDDPAVLESDSTKTRQFAFNEAPVADALERIKKVYGINVIYNADDLKDCQLTASLTDESLFQKLDVITQSIGATYQMIDGEIIIVAKGCKSD